MPDAQLGDLAGPARPGVLVTFAARLRVVQRYWSATPWTTTSATRSIPWTFASRLHLVFRAAQMIAPLVSFHPASSKTQLRNMPFCYFPELMTAGRFTFDHSIFGGRFTGAPAFTGRLRRSSLCKSISEGDFSSF